MDNHKFKKKTYAWMPKNKTIQNVMSSTFGVISINWVFQGILGMDTTDKIFKILFDIICFWVSFLFLNNHLSLSFNVVVSFFIAHTINWLFNGHIFVIGRFIGFTNTDPQKFSEYIEGIKKRASKCRGLEGVAIFGSVTRNKEFGRTSDLDIRFIRKPGFLNGLVSVVFTFMERSRAFVHSFPLDLYLYDQVSRLSKMRPDEPPLLLFDPNLTLARYYNNKSNST